MAVVPTKLRAPQSGASMPVSGRETMAKPVARDTMAKAQLIADEDVETAEGSSEIRNLCFSDSLGPEPQNIPKNF